MPRISTGNAELDALLDGGFPPHSINVVMGEPGTGKTVFAQQLAFANAGGERPVLFASTLSEPLPKFIAHLQLFGFSDPARVGTDILYEDLAQHIAHAPERLPDIVLELIQRSRPRIILIDSFKAIGDLMPDAATWRRVLSEVAGVLSAFDATSFWIGEYTPDMLPRLPEFAVADGIIAFTRRQHGRRDNRYVRIVKLRGSGFATGEHAFWIDAEGLKVFPRLVTPPAPPDYRPTSERVRTGIEGLDDMIESGWLRGTSTLVAGPSGAGKTVLGLHFLREGVREGDPGLLVNFQENPVQLDRVMANFGWQPERLRGAGKLEQLYISPVELQIDSIVGIIFDRIEHQGVRRVVIDALADLAMGTEDPRRFRDFLYSLTQYLARRNVTTLLNIEATTLGGERQIGGHEVSYMTDNILLVQMFLDTDLIRTLRVTKSRGSGHDGRLHVLHITRGGIKVE